MTDCIFTSDIPVRLIKTDFDDKWPVLAARVSTMTDKDFDPVKDKGLINRLMADRHGSPFEQMDITFLVKAPIFVWREQMRHRMASYNEQSGRYTQLAPEFYIPNSDRKVVQTGKAMDYNFSNGTPEQHVIVESALMVQCKEAYEDYQYMIDNNISNEVARMILPLNIMSSAYVKMNCRSLMNFLSLRVKSDEATYPSNPQREINVVADQFEDAFRTFAPITHAAFVANGRVAP